MVMVIVAIMVMVIIILDILGEVSELVDPALPGLTSAVLLLDLVGKIIKP